MTEPSTDAAGFTDGKPRIASEATLLLPFKGKRDGSKFRCRLCGHRFKVGDWWRFVLANIEGSPSRFGNFITCQKCDGPDILERAGAQEAEARQRFWWWNSDFDQ